MIEIRSFQRPRHVALDTVLKDAAKLVPSQCCELLVTKRKRTQQTAIIAHKL